MKIGVFGDSYADKRFAEKHFKDNPKIWYNFLELEYNHDIDCYGESGSSILFSADLIEKYACNYDLAIWCLTIPGRFSLPHVINDRSYHITTAGAKCQVNDVEINKKHSVCIDYLKYIFDWDSENLVGRSIVDYLMNKHKNIMIIPCFRWPLDTEFHLYKLCLQEANIYFPKKTIPEIYENYNDLRPGHISVDNQKILARLINEKLEPGIFQTDYSNFISPVITFEEMFRKK